MTGALAATGCLTKEFQTVIFADGEGRDRARFVREQIVRNTASVEQRFGRVECKETRILIFNSKCRFAELARGGIKVCQIDALAG